MYKAIRFMYLINFIAVIIRRSCMEKLLLYDDGGIRIYADEFNAHGYTRIHLCRPGRFLGEDFNSQITSGYMKEGKFVLKNFSNVSLRILQEIEFIEEFLNCRYVRGKS